MEHTAHLKDILLVLGTAGIIVPLLLRLGVSSILGYLIVGVLLGPGVIGALADKIPALQTVAFSRGTDLSVLAELGVVFLLFLIGLELSLERLKTMKRLVFGLGTAQVVASLALISGGALVLGFGTREAAVLGMALSLSSTAIVVQLLSDQKRLGTQTGRACFSILLLQDLAVIPMLMLVALLAANTEGNIAFGVVQALVQAALAVLLIIAVGRYLLRPLLKMVASTQSTDLFMAAVLFIAVGTGVLAQLAGLSMALGAFIAGLMLAETEYRRAIEAIIEPFKGLLLGAFFLLVGLELDIAAVAQEPLKIVFAALVLIIIKACLIYLLGRLFGIGHTAAFESGLLLGPGGEFAFVIVAASVAGGVLEQQNRVAPLAVVTLTMLLIPLLGKLAAWLRPRLQSRLPAPPFVEAPSGVEAQNHVIVAGYGRVGKLIASMLEEHKIPHLVLDGDAQLVADGRKSGKPVYFGDASHLDVLQKCGLANARTLAITIGNTAKADGIVREARRSNQNVRIIVRARDERHAMKLYEAGATEAVPETVEAGLHLGEAVLVESGIAMGLAIASIHERRDGFRKLLGQPNRREQLKSVRRRLKSTLP